MTLTALSHADGLGRRVSGCHVEPHPQFSGDRKLLVSPERDLGRATVARSSCGPSLAPVHEREHAREYHRGRHRHGAEQHEPVEHEARQNEQVTRRR